MKTVDDLTMVSIVYFTAAGIAGIIAHKKGRSAIGFFLLAALLSPLVGLLASWFVSDRPAKACMHCGEMVAWGTIACTECGKALPTVV